MTQMLCGPVIITPRPSFKCGAVHTHHPPGRSRFAHICAAQAPIKAEGHICSSSQDHSNQDQASSLVQFNRRQLLQVGSVTALCSSMAIILPAAAAVAAESTSAAAGCSVQESSTGLKWCDIVVGDGAAPIQSSFTKAHYTAKLSSNGVVFDSSYQRKQPLIFKVGEREVIEAFDVAVLGAEDIPAMREGGKRLVVAPPGPMQKQGTKSLVWMVGMLDALEDAGELSAEGTPTSDLVFEIELLAKRRR